MDKERYLNRINLLHAPKSDAEFLSRLHQNHLFSVPFENLDIYAGNGISLSLDNLYEKIVINRRGGFCYELNYLFQWLLNELDFNSIMISARVINDAGEQGPEYDHMALLVEAGNTYLADVGFGDLFLNPVMFIPDEIQQTGGSYFKIHQLDDERYMLSMSRDGTNFQNQYSFNLQPRNINEFMDSCKDKQTNPNSHFVKNRICTKFIPGGRCTIRNNQWIETINNKKSGYPIENEYELQQLLLNKFNISI